MSDLLREELLRRLEAAADDFDGLMGISVRDLASGDEFHLNGDVVFPVASSIKIPILIELFNKAKAGSIDLDKKVTIRDGDKVKGSGVLKEMGDGTVTLTMRDLATLMIIVSDNTATNMLIDAVGMDDVNAMLRELGLEETRFHRKMQDHQAISEGRDNFSTPSEFARLMERLFGHEGIDQWVCDQTLLVLRKPKATPISRALPYEVEVADKDGDMPGVRCDVGVVYQPERPYVIAIMTKNVPPSDLKKLRTNEAITNVSKMTYEHFRSMK
ncbi:MAG: serine hydrolase [Candidatus Helarchaeota archaeon]|nr:serine hydrolase [Candidatus Helarchaeota archaeon]